MDGLSARTDRTRGGALIRAGATAALLLALGGAAPPAMTSPPAAAAAPPGLCRPGESPLFVCPIGGRTAAVCGLPRGAAAYRYGRPGRVEIDLSRLGHASRMFSGGGETQVSAVNGATTYTLYAGTYRRAFGADGRHDPAERAGLIVRRDGRIVSNRRCAGAPGMAAPLDRFMPAGSFVEH